MPLGNTRSSRGLKAALESNFGQLRINTNPAFPDEIQMQAAGFLEGYLTAERIFDYAYNMKSWLASQTNDTFKVGDWLFEQDRWARQQVKDHADASPGSGSGSTSKPSSGSGSGSPATPASYWRAVGLLISQFDGLMAGYATRLGELGPDAPLDRLTKWDFLVLNALGDMDDLLAIIFPDTSDGSDTSDYEEGLHGDAKPAATGRSRSPNPERDASFFFRPEDRSDERSEAAQTQGQQTQKQRTQTQKGQKALEVAASSASGSGAAAGGGGAGAGAGGGGGGGGGAVGGPLVAPPRGRWEELSPAQVRARIAMRGRCTALIKVTPGLDDLLLGHVTWWNYASMIRIYKHYNLGLTSLTGQGGAPANGRVSFSSYPGQISSADDWYMLGNGLIVTETSLDTFDHNRYNATYGCTTASLLSWQRVLAANLLAEDGPGWAKLAASYNGGTYNNQYMIVNLNLFNPGSELQPGLLTITEIIPGLAVTADATDDLLLGHFPSYNVPYFPEVYEAAGYRRHAEALAARGAAFAEAAEGISYQLAPRAKIFRRDAAGATELDSFRRLLRSNGWDHRPANADPLSATSPYDALCARGDIDPEAPSLYGCYDGKVTNYRRALDLSADAINGPTTEGGRQPFRWDAHGHGGGGGGGGHPGVVYRGMLEVFDTEWEEQRP
ncbi:Phospholipase B-like 1 [Pleodorina starrii]|nr:Phospholipase B-like 1 [Pleodorina starrii]